MLYDLLGRYHHHDLRDATVTAFLSRYSVDVRHATQVADTACMLFSQLVPEADDPDGQDGRFLRWAAMLHESGVSVAHPAFTNTAPTSSPMPDMPGFLAHGPGTALSRIVLAHRGKLTKVSSIDSGSPDWLLILCLRLAAVMHRARDGRGTPPIELSKQGSSFVLKADRDWLDGLPLTVAALHDEERLWSSVGRVLHGAQGRQRRARLRPGCLSKT